MINISKTLNNVGCGHSFNFKSGGKTSFNFSFINDSPNPSNVLDAYAQYREVDTQSALSQRSEAFYQIYLTYTGARAMWKFTTDGPESGHPANNYLWWLNGNGPGFNTHLKQSGDYLISITNGAYAKLGDGAIIEDFEKNIGDSLWNKIEAYIKSKSTAALELHFEYIGVSSDWRFHHDGFYTNATWPH